MTKMHGVNSVKFKSLGYYSLFPPMMSPAVLICAAQTRDQETADKQACSLLPTRASVLHARPLHAATQDSPFTFLCLSDQVSRRETRVHASRCQAGHSLRVRARRSLDCSQAGRWETEVSLAETEGAHSVNCFRRVIPLQSFSRLLVGN